MSRPSAILALCGFVSFFALNLTACATNTSAQKLDGDTSPQSAQSDPSPPRSPMQAAQQWAAKPPDNLPSDVRNLLNQADDDSATTIERLVRIESDSYHAIVSTGAERAIQLVIKTSEDGEWLVEKAEVHRTNAYWPRLEK